MSIRSGRGCRYKLVGRGGDPPPDHIAYVFFFGSNRNNSVAISRVEGTCRQRPCCVRLSLLCFLTLPYPNLPSPTAAARTIREIMTVPLLEGPEYISPPGFELGLGGPGPELDRT
jgi:hypothetical protein